MGLTVQQHQGLHGEGFIFAMASTAGLVVSRQSVDIDGIDWGLGYPGPLGSVRHPKIEVQVKTWSSPNGDEAFWHYRISTRHFNALADIGFDVRRYLVLVTVPAEIVDYASCDDECMTFRHAAYWVSLADEKVRPVGPDDPKTVAVHVPRRNLLTPDSLLALVAGKTPAGVVRA